MSEHDDLMACRGFVLAALSAEMDKRSKSDGLDWIDNERTAVAVAANQWAASHGRNATVTTADVERVEVRAVGHVDYARKLALYVAELVMFAGASGTEEEE